jgi:hypothetical protein
MLDEHRTPRRFWAEAVNTMCYVSNRIYLRVDAWSHTQGESLPCLWLQVLYSEEREEVGYV